MTTHTPTGNAYLCGDFAPVDEEVTLTDLTVDGRIPETLDGRYLRIGPNPIGDVDPSSYHWFLGDGMVHGVRIRDGRAEWYRNRWVRSASVANALGESRRTGPTEGGFDFAANTNVIGHADKTFAVVEAGATPFELTEELETVSASDFDGTLTGGYTAHPKRDPQTGELHAVAYNPMWGNQVRYSVTGADGRVRRSVAIETTGAAMVHDFALTARNIVVFDLPVTLDLPGPLRRLSGRAVPDRIGSFLRKASSTGRGGPSKLGLPYRWNPDYPARVGVLGRDDPGSSIRWFDVEPCYVFHPLNAFDDGDSVVVDVVRHPRTFDTDVHGPNEGPPSLDRWTIDTAAGTVTEERIDDRGQEFPRLDESLVGRRHRYGFTIGFGDDASDSVLFRHDLDRRCSQTRNFGPEKALSEFVHVGGAEEVPGVVMGFIHDRPTATTELRMLDHETLEDVASVSIPVRIPLGFHGNWIPA